MLVARDPLASFLVSIWSSCRYGDFEAAVGWFMYKNGLLRPAQRRSHAIASTDRCGRRLFSEAEDALILELRREGLAPRAIAAAISERLGHPRNWRSVKVRLTILAGFEAEAEERAELGSLACAA